MVAKIQFLQQYSTDPLQLGHDASCMPTMDSWFHLTHPQQPTYGKHHCYQPWPVSALNVIATYIEEEMDKTNLCYIA